MTTLPAIADAVDHLAGRGHRSIGFIGANLQLSSGRERFSAFRDSLQRHGIAMRGALTITAAPSFRMGHESLLALLDGNEAMTALVCGGFEISNGALDACLERGLRFRDDLAFVGYGDPGRLSMDRWRHHDNPAPGSGNGHWCGSSPHPDSGAYPRASVTPNVFCSLGHQTLDLIWYSDGTPCKNIVD
ncbi:substrate-binding domain-containing protein (plasmid) [Rhizobium sp. RCAM05350]|nr:substrate-binding domain-containing protein [Rhizobium sp. RCAM05350]